MRIIKYLFLMTIGFLLIIPGCKSRLSIIQPASPLLPQFDVEAHRGGRGIMPENTIPAMINALRLGVVTTLEMDAHVTLDGKVVLAHDDHINPLFTLTPEGKELSKSDAEKLAVFKMNYADIKKFDTGSKHYKSFPGQRKLKTYIPLLSEVIDSVQHYLKVHNKPQIFYNIETKSKPAGDNILHPKPDQFVKLIMDVVKRKNITQYVIIQSFDVRTLQVLHAKYPDVKTSLIAGEGTLTDNLKRLGFTPDIYSPASKLVSPKLIKECHDKGIKILPWTINTKEEISRLRSLNVDGIVSDYPDFF